MSPLTRRLAAFAVLAAIATVRADDATAGRAREVLTAHCVRCHGDAANAKGGFGYVLDRERLVSRGKVVPGKPADSPLVRMVESGEMPPAGRKRPSAEELTALRQWVAAGAPAPPRAERRFLADADVLALVRADLQSMPARQRRFARYLTLAPLHNGGASPGELQETRQAVSKLVNSLSWHRRITIPTPVGPEDAVLRLDLRDYLWNARVWDRLSVVYPYRVADNALSRELAAWTGAELPVLRADWFVATASRPPFYHDFLQAPLTDRDTERLVRVDSVTNWQEERVARSGFNGSGVSRNNRLIERHDAAYGAYWRSYDFSDNTDQQNLFERPLGPIPGRRSFVHAGGELIFNLPNGLQGYLLVDANGRRVDKAPVEIVSDPRRPDRTVENGLSCIGCHARGLLFKADQVRAHVAKNPTAFAREDAELVEALYPSEPALRRLFDEDSERFVAALAKTGVRADDLEPVTAVVARFEGVLDLAAASAEAGLKPDEFTRRLRGSAALTRALGPLLVRGGTVQRSAFEAAFVTLAREFRLGTAVTPLEHFAAIPNASSPFTGHTGPVACIAISTDGRQALSGGEDRAVRLWDVTTGAEVRTFVGAGPDVLAVALAADGTRAAAAGRDRHVCVWDVASGKLRHRLAGHTDAVAAVAFAPDGKRLLSGGHDRTIRLWDVESGKELMCFASHTGRVHHVAFAPDGKRFLSAGGEGAVRLWDVSSGKELLKLGGPGREVFAVAFSPDGRHAASGGADRVARLWDLSSGKALRRFEGHAGSVVAVAFADGGGTLLTAGSQYRDADRVVRRWDVADGREIDGPTARDGESVWCAAFASDGRFAVTGGSAGVLRMWKLR